ncbi:MAG: hypothetical protein L3J16_02160, partial [Anaerolineales bacterium]|nr:hypothetical protein [Anaerolineales bacterium]
AVNLAISMAGLWPAKTLLIDLAMTAGQVALMLNAPLKRTWADLARFTSSTIDIEAINSVIAHHDSGLSFIPAPTFPAEAAALTEDTMNTALEILLRHYDYIIADLPHDFSPHIISTLDKADQILLLVAPEMASIRAAAAALDTYAKLDYPTNKIMAILNATFPRSGLSKSKIEAAISMPITMTVPYLADQFVQAINYGKPLVENNPESSIAGLFEDFSFHLSKDNHKKEKPPQPTETWLRVYKRFMARR